MAVSPRQLFPRFPSDGQIFVDAFRIRWVYSASEDVWTKLGPAIDVPLARSGDCSSGSIGTDAGAGTSGTDCLGPTNGLLSAKLKSILDTVGPKPGGFGLIFKPGTYLTPEGGADNVLTGNVNITSESLDITCEDVMEGNCSKTIIKFALSDDFLDTFCIEVRGGKGQIGETGDKGLPGKHGTGDGPVGATGAAGVDASINDVFTGIKIVESDDVYDTAVVDLVLNSADGILDVVKSKMAVPDNNLPASKVAASAIFRDVEFTGADLDVWQLTAPPNDPAGIIDVSMVRLPNGWNGGVVGSVPVISMKLSSVVQLVVDYYKSKAVEAIALFDAQITEFMTQKDEDARKILAELAQELAECEFSRPISFCVGIQPCPV